MRDFTKLIVWQRAEALSERADRLLRHGTFRSAISLGNQLERSAASIGALIAEGSGAATRRHYASYLDRAAMSANEVSHHLRRCRRQRLIGPEEFESMLDETGQIRRMLVALRKRVLSEPD